MTERRTRRQVLAIAGTGFTVSLAGCLATGATDDPDDHTPTETGTETEEPSDMSHSTDHTHGDDHHDGPVGPQPTASVAMTTGDDGVHFGPHIVWVEVDGTVEWQLDSGTHTTTAYHPDNDRPLRIPETAASWDSGILSDGSATFSHTFETAGVYNYYCTPHEEMGMIAAVIVGDPDPANQPGLTPPGDEHSSTVSEKIRSLNADVESLLDGGH